MGRKMDHLLNSVSHELQKRGHKDASGAIDGVIRQSKSKFVRECTQDRRAKRSGDPTVRIIHQKGR